MATNIDSYRRWSVTTTWHFTENNHEEVLVWMYLPAGFRMPTEVGKYYV